MSNSKPMSRAESVNAAYKQRLGNLEASAEKDAADIEEADTLEHEVHELDDAQKFVGGVEVKKDAATEEDFVPTPAAEETVDETVEAKDEPAKKTAAKK